MFVQFSLSLIFLLLAIISRIHSESNDLKKEIKFIDELDYYITNRKDILFSSSIELLFDPPNFASFPHAMALFVQVKGNQSARIYYEMDKYNYVYKKTFIEKPSLDSKFVTFRTPYIQIDSPYLYPRQRNIYIVAVIVDPIKGLLKSKEYFLTYFVEAKARPKSFGYFVPGLESSGYFLKVALEIVAKARAQATTNQEFADYFTGYKAGTYNHQVDSLHLPTLDSDLIGFEGGYAINVSSGQFGVLVPYHNGKDFFGKVIRIDLFKMGANSASCMLSYSFESIDAYGNLLKTGTSETKDACITVLDLTSINPNARGFRRGFVGYPYVYLSPGEFSVPVRLDMESFGISSVKVIDLTVVNSTYGGYSGGFSDGSWACFCPLKTFYGPVGGLRSQLTVDRNQLQPYYHGNMLCINETAWYTNITNVHQHIRTINPANISPDYRGFSDAIRVGRYAYLCPYSNDVHSYFGKIVRIYLGNHDIGSQIDLLIHSRLPLSTIVDVLDLSEYNPNYKGFSSIFYSGHYIFLVPFRNENQLYNGQRGHGNFVKVDMNNFQLSGITGIDLTVTIRNQIPSFAEVNLRGFSYGFASGWYGVLVPFYTGFFSGKVARLQICGAGASSLDGDLQDLDLAYDKYGNYSGLFKGFRGGFVSLWQGTIN